MQATRLLKTRIVYAETAFAELVLWRVPKPVAGSTHTYKYRLAYLWAASVWCGMTTRPAKVTIDTWCEKEAAYVFDTPDSLLADFQRDVARWNREHGHS